jgi:predicted metalloprotease with PDZ domain
MGDQMVELHFIFFQPPPFGLNVSKKTEKVKKVSKEAQEIGLQCGDRVIAVDGVKTSSEDVLERIKALPCPGTQY